MQQNKQAPWDNLPKQAKMERYVLRDNEAGLNLQLYKREPIAVNPAILEKAAPAAPPPDPKKPRPPKVEDFFFQTTAAGGCSTSLVSGFTLSGWMGAASYVQGRYVANNVDWSLPLPDEFIEAMKKKFNTTSQPWPGGGTANVLLASTVCSQSKEYKQQFRITEGKPSTYDVIDHVLERTGWIRGGCGMGQHGYPIQAWTRPSRGIQMDYKE